MNDLKKTVLSAVPDLKLLENVSYKEITTIGVGSSLPLLADISSVEQLKKVLKAVRESGAPFFILGAGSNLIGMDAPYPGLALRLESSSFGNVKFSGVFMRCGAALRLTRAARFAADEGLGGLSELSGIPGTLGGAVRMNAGASGQEIGNLVRTIKGVTCDGEDWSAKGSELLFFYRGSSLPENVIITEVELELQQSDAGCEREKIKVETERRKIKEPAVRSAGCTFRNVSSLEPAGKLID